jgi:hypothetical protein
MSKYLTKLKNISGNNYIGTLEVRYNIESYGCGDSYKNGLKHKFESHDKSDVILLIDIIKRFRLGTVITNITEKSFEFENTTERRQIFCFRLCRFVRTASIKKILENIILINKSGVRIQNAFILGHYYSHVNSLHNNIPYYYGPRDMIWCKKHNDFSKEIHVLNKPYKTLKECIFSIDSKEIYYSCIFEQSKIDLVKEKTELFNILKTKDFKKAERYLLKTWKLK